MPGLKLLCFSCIAYFYSCGKLIFTHFEKLFIIKLENIKNKGEPMTPSGLHVGTMGFLAFNTPKPENCPRKNLPNLGGCCYFQLNNKGDCTNFSANCTFNISSPNAPGMKTPSPLTY